MKTYFDFHFQKNMVVLYPGDFFSTADSGEMISTVLGSCIAITLFDASTHIGGMNHFMLVSSSAEGNATEEKSGRFGEYAVELLLNDMIKKGARKKRMIAKVFGGSNLFNIGSDAGVGAQNIFFAFDYLERERIPVKASDVGGNYSRKIYFDPMTSKVWLKHVKKQPRANDILRKREEEYRAQVREQENKKNDIVWF